MSSSSTRSCPHCQKAYIGMFGVASLDEGHAYDTYKTGNRNGFCYGVVQGLERKSRMWFETSEDGQRAAEMSRSESWITIFGYIWVNDGE